MRPILLTILFSLFSWAPIIAQGDQASRWQIKDVINQERINSPAFSPDGKMVVWSKRRPAPKKDKFVSDLYLTRLDSKGAGKHHEVQLTRSDDSDSSPLFSKDGETIYFLSSRAKGKKLWAMSVFGGEPFSVDSFPNGISSLKWLNDSTFTYLANEGATLYERTSKKKKDNTVVIEDTAHVKPVRVFAYHLKKKKSIRLTDNKYPVSTYSVSRNGKWIATTHIRSPHYGADGQPKPVYFLWNVETGEKTQILSKGFQTPRSFAFDYDNAGFYFSSVRSSNPKWNGAGISLLHYYSLADGKVTNVDLKWDWGISGGLHVLENGVMVGLANGPLQKVAFYEKDENKWRKKDVQASGEMDEHITVAKFSPDYAQVIFQYSTASHPTENRIAKVSHDSKKIAVGKGSLLASINKHLKKKTKAKS